MALHQARMVFNIGLVFFYFGILFSDLCKKIGNGLGGATA